MANVIKPLSANKKLIFSALVMLLLPAGLYGCGSNGNGEHNHMEHENSGKPAAAASTGTAPEKKDLLTLKTWSRKDCSLTPWLVTEKLGYFKEEGLKLEYTGETQPTSQIPSILSGVNNVGDWHPNTFAVAKAAGSKLVGVVEAGEEPAPDIDPKFRHMWWFVNPDSGIKSFQDLKDYKKGKKLKFSTITNNICADFLGNLIADKYGIPRDRIEWVSMPDVQAIQALKQGLVDVAGVHPPFYKGMEQAGAVKIADSSEAGLGSAAGVSYYVFSEDFVKKNPETVRRFVRAIVRGQKYANEHPDQAAKWTEEAIGQPVTGVHYYGTTTKINESLIQPWLDELVKGGVLKNGQLKPSDIITHQFEQSDL